MKKAKKTLFQKLQRIIRREFSFCFCIYFALIYQINSKYHSIPLNILLILLIFALEYHGREGISITKLTVIGSIRLLHSIALLTANINYSTLIFLVFINQTMISQFSARSPICLITLFSEIYFLYCTPEVLANNSIVFIGFSIISQIALHVLNDKGSKFSSFPSKTMIFALLIDVLLGKKVHNTIFLLSIVLSYIFYPDFIRNTLLSKENLYSIMYLITSFTLNIYGICYGQEKGSSALVSSSTLSFCNSVSLTVVLAGDLISRMKSNNIYSFGYKNVKHVFKFVSTSIILFSAYNLLDETVAVLFEEQIFVKNPWPIVLLSAADFALTLIGALTIGNVNLTSFTLLSDISISCAALISALFDSIFDLPQFDHLVSIVIVGMICMTAIPEVIGAVKSLLLIPNERTKQNIIKVFKLNPKTTFIYISFSSPRNEICISCSATENEKEKLQEEMQKYFSDRNIELTLEISVIE